jgi:GNAT superfamily N-acetyltransferase
MDIRPARAGEEAALTELAVRSKAHWGYDEAFMERARSELTITREDLDRLLVRVAERDGRPVGMSGLDLRAAELTHLFVEPRDIGTGVGRALLAHALDEARAAGLASVRLESDPDAERFYLAAGAERIGERRAGTGRMLPLLRIVTGS